jgi:hypothetical protein
LPPRKTRSIGERRGTSSISSAPALGTTTLTSPDTLPRYPHATLPRPSEPMRWIQRGPEPKELALRWGQPGTSSTPTIPTFTTTSVSGLGSIADISLQTARRCTTNSRAESREPTNAVPQVPSFSCCWRSQLRPRRTSCRPSRTRARTLRELKRVRQSDSAKGRSVRAETSRPCTKGSSVHKEHLETLLEGSECSQRTFGNAARRVRVFTKNIWKRCSKGSSVHKEHLETLLEGFECSQRTFGNATRRVGVFVQKLRGLKRRVEVCARRSDDVPRRGRSVRAGVRRCSSKGSKCAHGGQTMFLEGVEVFARGSDDVLRKGRSVRMEHLEILHEG